MLRLKPYFLRSLCTAALGNLLGVYSHPFLRLLFGEKGVESANRFVSHRGHGSAAVENEGDLCEVFIHVAHSNREGRTYSGCSYERFSIQTALSLVHRFWDGNGSSDLLA